jgi:hypothetical protein
VCYSIVVGNRKTMIRLTTILLILTSLISCSEIKTTDQEEVYKYWSGSATPADLELLEGQFWQSSHWAREYIMFLKLKPTEEWWVAFLDQNQLQIDDQWIRPSNAPEWFTPTAESVMYSSGDTFDQGSRYFKDTLTNECYIYEIQL